MYNTVFHVGSDVSALEVKNGEKIKNGGYELGSKSKMKRVIYFRFDATRFISGGHFSEVQVFRLLFAFTLGRFFSPFLVTSYIILPCFT